MITVLIVGNLIIGTLIGISGIAGFLLPILLTGFLGMPVADALALSFVSFLTSGVVGAFSYTRAKQMDFSIAIPLAIGSIVGALLGVRLNVLIPVSIAKLLLYVVVLCSGISVLSKLRQKEENSTGESLLLKNKMLLVLLGFLTAAICSLTGAGGPVLVVPILAALGVNMRTAVGISLLDSVAIALPASIGYLTQTTNPNILMLCLISVLAHGIGVVFGAKVSGKVNLRALRLMVGLLALTAATYMIITTILTLL